MKDKNNQPPDTDGFGTGSVRRLMFAFQHQLWSLRFRMARISIPSKKPVIAGTTHPRLSSNQGSAFSAKAMAV